MEFYKYTYTLTSKTKTVQKKSAIDWSANIGIKSDIHQLKKHK